MTHRIFTSPDRPASPAKMEMTAGQDEFFTWVFAQAGLDPHLYRLQPLQRRLPVCLRTLKARSTEEARQSLENHPGLILLAIRSLLIGVSSFFRDPAVFECLWTEIVPEWAQLGHRLRIWSAACAHGAELYSVAILLAKAGMLDRADLLGTDCRPDVIAQAAAGLFSDEMVSGLDPSLREQYLRRQDRQWQWIPPSPAAIHWKIANIGEAIEPGPWDLILFRNAAIYMSPQAVQPVWQALADALRPGGYLIVGKAERPTAAGLRFVNRCIWRKDGTPCHD